MTGIAIKGLETVFGVGKLSGVTLFDCKSLFSNDSYYDLKTQLKEKIRNMSLEINHNKKAVWKGTTYGCNYITIGSLHPISDVTKSIPNLLWPSCLSLDKHILGMTLLYETSK